jgi:hypothetical protein
MGRSWAGLCAAGAAGVGLLGRCRAHSPCAVRATREAASPAALPAAMTRIAHLWTKAACKAAHWPACSPSLLTRRLTPASQALVTPTHLRPPPPPPPAADGPSPRRPAWLRAAAGAAGASRACVARDRTVALACKGPLNARLATGVRLSFFLSCAGQDITGGDTRVCPKRPPPADALCVQLADLTATCIACSCADQDVCTRHERKKERHRRVNQKSMRTTDQEVCARHAPGLPPSPLRHEQVGRIPRVGLYGGSRGMTDQLYDTHAACHTHCAYGPARWRLPA